jgi:putative transposase
MPEHFHLLITEPEVGDPSVVMKVIKQRFTRQMNRKHRRTSLAQTALWEATPEPVWQKRFHDFNVWSEPKRIAKLRYMHRNPVKRRLVEQPDNWKWRMLLLRCQEVGNCPIGSDKFGGEFQTYA